MNFRPATESAPCHLCYPPSGDPGRPQLFPQAGAVLLRPGAPPHAYASGTHRGVAFPQRRKGTTNARFFLIPSRGAGVSDGGACHHFHDCCHCAFSGDRSLESPVFRNGLAPRLCKPIVRSDDRNAHRSFDCGCIGRGCRSATAGPHQHDTRRQSLALAISDANAGFI
jgi:hypothetical protein